LKGILNGTSSKILQHNVGAGGTTYFYVSKSHLARIRDDLRNGTVSARIIVKSREKFPTSGEEEVGRMALEREIQPQIYSNPLRKECKKVDAEMLFVTRCPDHSKLVFLFCWNTSAVAAPDCHQNCK